jgi:hypothetical protein
MPLELRSAGRKEVLSVTTKVHTFTKQWVIKIKLVHFDLQSFREETERQKILN